MAKVEITITIDVPGSENFSDPALMELLGEHVLQAAILHHLTRAAKAIILKETIPAAETLVKVHYNWADVLGEVNCLNEGSFKVKRL